MSLESATFLSELITSNPTGADLQSQGDDHIRLLKSVLQATFPNADRAFRFPTGSAVITSSPTLAATDSNKIYPVDASAVARAVTLPSTSLTDGLTYYITKVDTSVNVVTVESSALINGVAAITLRYQWDAVRVWYNLATTTWYAELITPRFGQGRLETANTAVVLGDFMGRVEVDCVLANKSVTLPSTLPEGFMVTIQKVDDDEDLTVTVSAAANINGAASIVLTEQWEEVTLFWNGTTWRTWNVGPRFRAIDALIAANFNTVNIQAFTGSGTYTPTTGMKYCVVIATGAGGGGGGSDGVNPGSNTGGGGAAGATVIDFFTAAQIGASKTVTIGAAGTAGAIGADGTAGGSTILSGGLLTAEGGAFGPGSNSAGHVAGGEGAMPAAGTIKIPGGDGGTGSGVVIGGGGGDGRGTVGAPGGASFWGGGPRGVPGSNTGSAEAAGEDGLAYGTGGGGGMSQNSATGSVGGAGAPGFMMIIEFM